MEKISTELGNVSAVIGAQWGDEGKGKLIDVLTPHFDVLARACGGANAGHTIVVGGEKRVFHLLPAGCLHPHVQLVLGSGMAIHLPTLLEEIHTLREAGIDVLPRLKISAAAHLVTEDHKRRDADLEEARSGGSLGTTLRGIGPAYTDKAARVGVRVGDLLTSDPRLREFREEAKILKPCITDTVTFLQNALKRGSRILIEGAQGTFLDLDHGTYPFVTSSSTTVAGALQGLGLAPRCLTSCIGVAKAYCTRVGGGPFTTEADPLIAERLRERGGEFGATTGRPRRCGWLSLPDMERAAAINGFTHWNITKLDVLDELDDIPVCVDMKNDTPIYEKMRGWRTQTARTTDFERLPVGAQAYLRFIERHTNVPVTFIGTGPDREAMIVRHDR